MDETQPEVNDTAVALGAFRHIFLESLASSPRRVSSFPSTASFSVEDVSIETCIKYLQSSVSEYLSSDLLDQFKVVMEETSPNGRVNWEIFEKSAQRWISIINARDKTINSTAKHSEDAVDYSECPGTPGKSDMLHNMFEEKSPFSKWPDSSINSPADNNNSYNSTNLSVESQASMTDYAKVTEIELRLRLRRIEEDNSWLRDELQKAEELTTNYQQEIKTIRQKFDQINEKCNRLARENEEQKEMLSSAEKEDRRCQSVLKQTEKERREISERLASQLEIIPELQAKIEKLNSEKFEHIKQLTALKADLDLQITTCHDLQIKVDETVELNENMEKYYEKVNHDLQEQIDDLKNANITLQSRFSLDQPTSHCITSLDDLDNSNNLLGNESNGEHLNSIFEELKATGFSIESNLTDNRVQKLEDELEWQNLEIHRAVEKINKLINEIDGKGVLDDISDVNTDVFGLFTKIDELSHKITESRQKPLTTHSASQVCVDQLAKYRLSQLHGHQNKLIDVEKSQLEFFEPGERTDHLSKSIYTITDRSIPRRRSVSPSILNIGACGDVPINDNFSSLSLHSSIKPESKINLRSAMSVNGVESNDEIFGNTHSTENCEDGSLPESASPSILSSTRNMAERNSPRRKVSVFSRYDGGGKHPNDATTSSPVYECSEQALTGYRTSVQCSDSSTTDDDTSKLESSIEEGGIGAQQKPQNSFHLAVPKLNPPSVEGTAEEPLNRQVSQDRTELEVCSGGSINIAKENQSSAVTLEMSSSEGSWSSNSAATSDKHDTCVSLQGVVESEESGEVSLATSPSKATTSSLKTFTYKPSPNCEIAIAMKRSRSESSSLGQQTYYYVNHIEKPKSNENNQELQLVAFPNFTDIQLQALGDCNIFDNDQFGENNCAEDVLERKFLAFSLGLCTDRLTLSRRQALSLRQRDQTERNLNGEVMKLKRNIQELAPLCFDSETIERLERAKNQVGIIAQCAHKVSCTAETLGAIQQEFRVSKAIHVADRYLRLLRNRCDKVVADLAETKRILLENNIIIDDHVGEPGEDLATLSFRGIPPTNRTMMAKRRASIATIFRPLGQGQDGVKDGIRQRNSVSGRVTLRRPSFSGDTQRWEMEKLNRTESSNSVVELRQIFEQTESRKVSIEENNNIMRLSASRICQDDLGNAQALALWPCDREDTPTEIPHDRRSSRIPRLGFVTRHCKNTWCSMIWCIFISFLLGFYAKDAISAGTCLQPPFKWWSWEEILERHVDVRNLGPRPI